MRSIGPCVDADKFIMIAKVIFPGHLLAGAIIVWAARFLTRESERRRYARVAPPKPAARAGFGRPTALAAAKTVDC